MAYTLDGNLNDYDFEVKGNKVILTHRLNGEQSVFKKPDLLEFDSDSFTLDELRALSDSAMFNVTDGTQQLSVNNPDPTISVELDRLVQALVIETSPGPTVAARAYAMVHTAAYDAWATFDKDAARVSLDGADGDNLALEAAARKLGQSDAVKEQAMAYAGYEVLSELFPAQQAIIDTFMAERLGYSLDPGDGVAAAIGLDAAEDLLALRSDDGSNQSGGYADTTGYVPVNSDPAFEARIAIDRWTPEYVPIDSDSNLQTFLTPQWGEVESFALPEGGIPIPEPEAFLLPAFSDAVVDFASRTIDIDGDGVGFEPITRDMIGTVINPDFIAQAEQVVQYSAELDDAGRMSAEFYEDAGGTGFPPGTWMTFGEFASRENKHDVGDDAEMFMVLGNAMLDASIVAWGDKETFDYVRPVRAIRDLGYLELIGDEDGFIEAFGGFENGEASGTELILATEFVTYQRDGADASPPFAEYPSGHSTFSAAGAAVLSYFVGEEFGGSVIFEPGSALFASNVPEDTIVFSWETWKDAADAAGESRLFGGIHFVDGDQNGRTLGTEVGEGAIEQALLFIEGTATDTDRPFYEDTLIF